MTNWPNIQEYRNFEAKFFNNTKNNDLICAADDKADSVFKNDNKSETEVIIQNPTFFQVSEPKTVRCVIKKDFEEAIKKFDRGDGASLNPEVQKPKQDVANQAIIDKIRLQNHLKWKKQKEEEYLLKKEAERIAQQKKVEEQLRKERLKKQKEKEKEEKIRQWQEQKAREKEEKRKEKLAMKMLEEDLKDVAPAFDKEKLLEEWVKLKNKQKQMEAEKKAEIQRKEEEGKALRQSLAELSYRQWKERLKGRSLSLPKNGYQIFGPKPVPVVKEDWNHDFINKTPRRDFLLRNTRSNTNSLSFRADDKQVENMSKDLFCWGGINSKSPSVCNLKSCKSGFNLWNGNEFPTKSDYEMPLKELQPGTIELIKNFTRKINGVKDDYEKQTSKAANILEDRLYEDKYLPKEESQSSTEADQSQCLRLKKPLKALGVPTPAFKKKIDLYINTGSENMMENTSTIQLKNQIKTENKIQQKIKKFGVDNKSLINKTKAAESKEKTFIKRSDTKTLKQNSVIKISERNKGAPLTASMSKICRRSKSYDKPIKLSISGKEKLKGCSSSGSLKKGQDSVWEENKELRKKTSQKRKSRKPSTPEQISGNDNKKMEVEKKIKRNFKKKNIRMSKSLTLSDSPYCSKKPTSKNAEKGKKIRLIGKTGGTKSDRASGQSRKISATKI